ncbi:MAG TPA: hypothetical protein VKD91_20045 [Pyrinomonadaceae bacterium]|nr:hypothetical protein [Pyrinomonadaceae bacterium]
MIRASKFTVFFLILAKFGLAAAHGSDNRTVITYLNNDSEAFGGRLVEVKAKVIAINADSKSLELFDSESRTTIRVNLAQLPKAERSALVQSGARRVMVFGRAWVIAGRMVIDAQKVEALPAEINTQAQTTPAAGTDDPR